jgi:hypothetical protein
MRKKLGWLVVVGAAIIATAGSALATPLPGAPLIETWGNLGTDSNSSQQ